MSLEAAAKNLKLYGAERSLREASEEELAARLLAGEVLWTRLASFRLRE